MRRLLSAQLLEVLSMNNIKVATPPERAAADSTTDITHNAHTEQSKVLKHLLNGLTLNCDEAYKLHDIKHLHSLIPKIEKFIKVERVKIQRPHPNTGKIRPIASYWIEQHVIDAYSSKVAREALRKQQVSSGIAKNRANDNKALIRLCGYCKYETMVMKLNDIYGKQAANDD